MSKQTVDPSISEALFVCLQAGGEARCLMDFWAQRCLQEIREADAEGVPPPAHTTDGGGDSGFCQCGVPFKKEPHILSRHSPAERIAHSVLLNGVWLQRDCNLCSRQCACGVTPLQSGAACPIRPLIQLPQRCLCTSQKHHTHTICDHRR